MSSIITAPAVTRKGSGFWFLDSAESCPWKWLLHYYYDIEPEHTPPALLWGQAMHSGVEGFLSSGDYLAALAAFTIKMASNESSYEKHEKYNEDMSRGTKLLELYCRKYANELDEYEFLAIEEDLCVTIGGFDFNFRVDAVAKSRRTGVIQGREIKTSSSLTPVKVFGKVQDQDQVTAYLYAWNLKHPDQYCELFVPDVLYNNKSVYDCQRMTSGVYRSRAEMDEWALGAVQFYAELTQRMKTLAAGKTDQHQLFKRAFSCDGDGFFRCDYKPICRCGYPRKKGDVPHGYRVRQRRD
jgi:hypothetical protein